MNRKSVYALVRVAMMSVGLLMFVDGIASASSASGSAVTGPDTRVALDKLAISPADRTADESLAQQDTKKSRYCSKAETGTDPNENEDLKPMAIQIRDTLRRQYCGQ